MLPFLFGLLALGPPAHADDARVRDDLEAIEPGYVLLDAARWLYAEPRRDARRVRAADVPRAPDHLRPPVLVLVRKVRTGDGWLGVEPAPMPQAVDLGGSPRAPTVMPHGWPHCFPQTPGLGVLRGGWWVHEDDLARVLTRQVTVRTSKGALTLEPGVAVVAGRAGRHRLRTWHLSLVADVPADAIADHLPLTLSPPRHRGWTLGDGSIDDPAIHPRWSTRAQVSEGGAVLRDPVLLPAAAQAVEGVSLEGAVFTDRCARLDLDVPVQGVPSGLAGRDETGAEDAEAATRHRITTVPISAPQGTEVLWADGVPLGEVGPGSAPLWSRPDCRYDREEVRMCCDPPPGLEVADGPEGGLCFLAKLELPVQVGLDVLVDKEVAAVERVQRLTDGEPVVRFAVDDVRGPIDVEDVTAALEPQIPGIAACYERALEREPLARGAVEVRMGIAGNGRPRTFQFVDDAVDVGDFQTCLEGRFNQMVVLDQIGQPASIARVLLDFELVRRLVDDTGDAPEGEPSDGAEAP